MGSSLRLLIVEDLESDAALIVRALTRGGYQVQERRVDTAEQMRRALAETEWDIVIADYRLPQFDAPSALAVLGESGLDLPVIVVSGTVGEETVVAIMKAGAHDCVMKDDLTRLVPAVERELREARTRRDRRKAESALRESENRFRSYVEDAPMAIIVFDAEGRYLDHNPAALAMCGYEAPEMSGLTMRSVVVTEDGELLSGALAALGRHGRCETELRVRTADGRVIWVALRAMRFADDRFLAFCQDVSERKRIERANSRLTDSLRMVNELAIELTPSRSVSELRVIIAEKLRDIADAAAVSVSSYDEAGGVLVLEHVALPAASRGLRDRLLAAFGGRMLGLRVPVGTGLLTEMLGVGMARFDGLYEVALGALPRPLAATVERVLGTGHFYGMALAGDDRLLGTCVVAMRRGADDVPEEVRSTLAKICSAAMRRATAEEALRRSEREHRELVENLNDVIFNVDADGRLTYISPAVTRVLGYAAGELMGTHYRDLVHQDDLPVVDRALLDVFEGRLYPSEFRLRGASGDYRWVRTSSRPLLVDGQPVGINGVLTDIHDQRQAAEAVASSRDYLAGVLDAIPDPVFVKDVHHRLVLVNSAQLALAGRSHADTLGKIDHDLMPKEQADAFWQDEDLVLERGEKSTREGLVTDVRSGETRTVATTKTRYESPTGERFVVGVIRDVTEQRTLEEQLRQSQKMEAIGQLAGGVAHDFNNILGVILARCELMADEPSQEAPRRKGIREIHAAAERAAALTRQLLVFSRKQAFRPQTVDLRATVSSLAGMLRRLIGEHIELHTSAAAGLGNVRVDPGHIEQVIINLAVNARDAMPDGGRLLIRTDNVDLEQALTDGRITLGAGRYVLLTVEDTGCGMDGNTLERMFEPFFTTKPQGRGTGLGLATVYGIVKQSGGEVTASSEPGRGTSFRVYLPRTNDAVQPVVPAKRQSVGGHGEQILVVEDEGALREIVEDVLESLGYAPTVAADPAEALAAVETRGLRPVLLLTDVVMPGMSGVDLTTRLRRIVPDLKVLFMSGYTDLSVFQRGDIDSDAPFIQKPFSVADLSERIRDVLAIHP